MKESQNFQHIVKTKHHRNMSFKNEHHLTLLKNHSFNYYNTSETQPTEFLGKKRYYHILEKNECILK